VSLHRIFIATAIAGLGPIAAAGPEAAAPEASARAVLTRFCELDAQGALVTSGGWQKVSGLFASPGAPRRERIMVVKDFVVSAGSEKGRSAAGERTVGFHVEYTVLGLIDSSQARFDPVPPSMHVEPSLFVVRQSGQTLGGASGRVAESADWQIDGTVPEPHLGVDAAIRYATGLRANAKDATIRKSAEMALAALKSLR
jgi:hypothetical protein